MGTIKDIHLYLSQRLRIKEEDMRLWLYNSEVGHTAYYGMHTYRKTVFVTASRTLLGNLDVGLSRERKVTGEEKARTAVL